MNFSNVTIIKKANVYFDGNVSSRTVVLPSGERKTLGFMMPGEYVFGTDAPELMELLAGQAEVRLKEEDPPKAYSEGDTFSVPGKSSYYIRAFTCLDYCCSYL